MYVVRASKKRILVLLDPRFHGGDDVAVIEVGEIYLNVIPAKAGIQ